MVKRIPRGLLGGLVLWSLGWANITWATDNPETRPALVGSDPNSLVNLINVNRLKEQKQGNGVVMFTTFILPGGRSIPGDVYRGTPGTDLLRKEVFHALTQAYFIPAIQHHKPVGVEFRGAVMFFGGDRPRLRVFANQNPDDLAKESDFVAPQLIAGTDTWKYAGEEVRAAVNRRKDGTAELALQVDASGKLNGCKVVHEDPPGFHFGDASCHALQYAQFLPGYRNGHPVDCSFHLTEFIHPVRIYGPHP